jgi:VanZ family protein
VNNTKLYKFLVFWLPVLIWAGIIFNFSAKPSVHASEFFWPDFLIKKTAHITEYAIFAVLIYRALVAYGVRKRNAGVYAILAAVMYASTDEFHQSFTPGREPTIRDVFFDTIGSVLGIITVWNLLPKLPPKLKNWVKRLALI